MESTTVVDSGACKSVVPQNLAPTYKLKELKNPCTYTVANGQKTTEKGIKI